MRKFYMSELYLIDKENYQSRREELMIKFLDEFFWKCFFMIRMNRVEGDYLEFGCGSNVRSFRLAYKYNKLENTGLRLFAFDSFEGLPDLKGIDKHPDWRKGSMAVSLEEFHQVMKSIGATPGEYQVVPGFYDKTLNGFSPADYGIKKAVIVFVDCDLYVSTMPVLKFVKDILTDGSVIAFDDWFCFNGDPNKGEQKAFREFLAQNEDIAVSEYLNFGWHGKSFIVHRPGHSIFDQWQTKIFPADRKNLFKRLLRYLYRLKP